LQAEGRKRRVAAADAGHEKLARSGRKTEAVVRAAEACNEADQEGARDVDEQRAPGEGANDGGRDRARQPEAQGASEAAAEPNPEIDLHDQTP